MAKAPPPGVVLDVDYVDGVFEFVLVNLGTAVARDVRVEFSRALIGLGGRTDISDLNVWKRVRTLRPGKEIRVLLDTAPNVFRRGRRNAFTVDVHWRTDHGRHLAKFRHDLEAYRDMPDIIR